MRSCFGTAAMSAAGPALSSGRFAPPLDRIPDLLLGLLAETRSGVIVLAIDGVSWATAARTLTHAVLHPFTSTFPSASVPAWLSAVTGRAVAEHGMIGTAYRCPSHDRVVDVITGRGACGDATACDAGTAGVPTIFARARAMGADVRVIGRELDHVHGPWPRALLAGAERVPTPDPLTTRPEPLAGSVVTGVDAALRRRPSLLWVYVNLDDHVHRHGYDPAVCAALRTLDTAASRWADDGWTVVAHADHGQVRVEPDPALARAWAELDSPRHCRLPGGGAGRVRWLYPRRETDVHARLAEVLGDHGTVHTVDELGEAGLLPALPAVRERIGEVVAVAAGAAFPVPDPRVRYEHGATSNDEMLVPFALWDARSMVGTGS